MNKETSEKLINLAAQKALQEMPFVTALAILGKFVRESAEEMVNSLSDEEKDEFLKEIEPNNA